MATSPPEAARLIPRLIEQHVEDAADLWRFRDSILTNPSVRLADLVRYDERLEAHLDGLRIAGEGAWALCQADPGWDDPGGLFAGCVLAFAIGKAGLLNELYEASDRSPELASSLVSALAWSIFEVANPFVQGLISSDNPARRLIGIRALVLHRKDPGRSLTDLVDAVGATADSHALRAIGELGRLDLVASAERLLRSEDAEVRFSAAWSIGLLSAKPEALSVLAKVAQSDSPHSYRALETAMRRANPSAARNWLHTLAGTESTLRLAVLGAGAIGDPAEMSWLIQQMKTPELARLSGLAFTTITGADIAWGHLEADAPAGPEGGPTDEPADGDVEPDADDNLPWPDVSLIEKWWQSNRHSFKQGTRYLLGKPIAVDWCKQILGVGRRPQRVAAALELAMLQPGTPLFEVRAPGIRQQRLLGL